MANDRSRRVGALAALVAALATLATLALLASACGSSSPTASSTATTTPGPGAASHHSVVLTSTGPPRHGGSLVYGVDSDPNGWNPTTARWSESGLTQANTVFDPLAAWGTHYDVEPYLAKSFTHSTDYRTWTIALRSGITFHDGTPFDAAAVVTELNALRASILTGGNLSPITSVDAVDGLTVAVHMSIPWSVFPTALTAQDGMMAAPSQIRSGDGSHPVGTGPFVFTSWTPNAAFVVDRNPRYWRRGLPYLDQITFKPILDGTTSLASLTDGDLDMLSTSLSLIKSKLAAMAAQHQVQLVYSAGESEEGSTMLNTSAPPFNDLRLRQALAYGTDTRDWAKATGTDPADLADGPFAPGSKWYVPTGYPTYDLARARALVAKVEAGSGPISFTLQCESDPTVAQMCQVLQSQWDRLGLHVTINSVLEPTLISNALTGAYQATIWRQFGEQDPDGDIQWWDSANTNPPDALNMSRNRDPIIDAALTVGRTSAKPFERKLAYITVARQLAKDLPYIWLNHEVWVVAARNNVRGLDRTTLPDGTPTDAVTSGVERLGQIWLT
jgi:peptide/nickel transport system substrate-binding protein